MSDKLNFLDGEEPLEPEVMSLDGVAGETSSAEPIAHSAVEPGQVPISALLDEREKRQAERAAREMLERQISELREKVTPTSPVAPEEAIQHALYNQNLRASRRFAEREYGKPAIQSVHDWAVRRCDEDPIFNHQMRSSEDPYEAACQAFNREQILAAVKPADLAAFKTWQGTLAKGATSRASAYTSQTALSAGVPRSLATAPGNGAAGRPHIPVGPGQAFHSAISR